MSSILTNNSAMVALQTLKTINNDLGKVQSEVATGLRVASAKDNSSSWSIASSMKADVASYDTLSNSLTSASALVGVGRTAAESITDILVTIQEKIVQAENPDANQTEIQAEVTSLTNTIVSIAQSAQYNGVNLVKATPDSAVITASINRSAAGALTTGTFTVAGVDLEALGAALTVGTATPDTIDALIDTAKGAAAAFGAAQARIDVQNDFLGKQADALTAGIGALVDADMEAASARLTALQTQQQLGTQALSIANQAPQAILSLFRN